MLLCLDVGNTHILCGLYDGTKLTARFRHVTHPMVTADQFGLFLRGMMQTHGIDHAKIAGAAMASVVPAVNYTLKHALTQYFPKATFFSLQGGVKTGLNIKYKNPAEVGADRIANAIGAVDLYPDTNLIIVDMGTATTFCAVTKNADYLGGAILPGMRVAMESLKSNTAKLMEVDMSAHDTVLGQTTRESIQKGLYFGQLGALREIIGALKREQFANEPVTVIGTGGFSQMFRDTGIFDVILPDLVLEGLRIAAARA